MPEAPQSDAASRHRGGREPGGAGGSRSSAPRTGGRAIRHGALAVLLALISAAVVWGAIVRATAGSRVVAAYGATPAGAGAAPAGAAPAETAPAETSPAETAPPGSAPAGPALDSPTVDTLRVLTWNIAHGRGDGAQGPVLSNFLGGGPEARAGRLARIAAVIRDADADIVALEEVDLDAAWSDGLDQAEALARAAGYPARVEQRDFDFSLFFFDFAFGNALLTRLPLDTARLVPLPPHSRLEKVLVGAKTAAMSRLRTPVGPIAVVPVHLEFRDEATRLAAVPGLQRLRDDAPPLILAGDFNTAPPGWPGVADTTAVGRLLEAGWRSARAPGAPADSQMTFPSTGPDRAIDWVLAEPPLRVLDARVLHDAAGLSDHLPVLATIEVPRAIAPGQ